MATASSMFDIRKTCPFYSAHLAPTTLLIVFSAIFSLIGVLTCLIWFPHALGLYLHSRRRPVGCFDVYRKFLRRYRPVRYLVFPVMPIFCIAIWGIQPLFLLAGLNCKDPRFVWGPAEAWSIWVAEGLSILACSSIMTIGWIRIKRARRAALTSGRDSANIHSSAEQGSIGMNNTLTIPSPDELTPTEDEIATEDDISQSNETPIDVWTPLAHGATSSHSSTQPRSSGNPQREHFVWEGMETLRQPMTLAKWQAFSQGQITAEMNTTGKTIDQTEADPTLNLLAAHKTNHRSPREIPPRDFKRAVRARSPLQSRFEPDSQDSAKTTKPKPAANEAARRPYPELVDRELSSMSFGWKLDCKLKRRVAIKKGSKAANSPSPDPEEIPLQELSIPKSRIPKPVKAHTLDDKPRPDTPLMDPKALKPSSRQGRATSWELEHPKPANGVYGSVPFKPDVFPPHPPIGKILKTSRLRTRIGADNMPHRPSPLRIDSGPASPFASMPLRPTSIEDNKSTRPITAESEISQPTTLENPFLDPSDAPAIQSVTSRGRGKLVTPDQSHLLQSAPVTIDTDNPTPPYTRPPTPLLPPATIAALQNVNMNTPPDSRLHTPRPSSSDALVHQAEDDQVRGRIVVPEQSRLERLGLLATRKPSEGIVFDLVSKDDEDEKQGFSMSRCTTKSLTGCVDDMQPLERCPKRPDSWDSGIGLDGSDAMPPR